MSNLNKKTVNDWILEREQQIAKEKAEFSNYISLQQGENKVSIDVNIPPVEKDGDYPDKTGKPQKRYIYTTTQVKNGKALLLSASKVLDRQIIACLVKGITEFTIIKVGVKKDTRYQIKELL